MDPRIETTKTALKAKILAGTAGGIIGVGVDSLEEKLIAFYVDHEEAVNTLQSVDAGFMEFVVLARGTPPPESNEVSGGGGSFFSRLSAFFASFKKKFPLRPTLVIMPKDGKKGYIGCFVEHQDSSKAVLTVVHVFHLRRKHAVLVRTSKPDHFKPLGESWCFANIKTAQGQSNLADCALFLPDMTKVTLERDEGISGNYVNVQRLPGTVKRKVTNPVIPRDGTVLDTTAMISYDLVIDGALAEGVVFDDQILVKRQNFGQQGHSGALIVMDKKESDRGDALGLYSYTTAESLYHFVTPFYACVNELGIASIYNPP